MGACNKLQISLRLWALEQFFALDYLWIYESVLTGCACANVLLTCYIMLTGYFWIYEYVMCILMNIIEALKQVMNLWQVVIYESAICVVFLDLWICNRLWFSFLWICYNVYFWIYVEQKQVMKNVKCKIGCDFFLFVKCFMDV